MHLPLITCLVLLNICCHVSGIEPVLSSPGNTTIMVIVDIHRNYDNSGTCSSPDWETFELAYSMWFNHINGTQRGIGLEIFDGCRSIDRTLSIIRDRLFSSQTASQVGPSVASVVTFVEPEVSEAISGAVLMSNTFHVTVGSPMITSTQKEQGNSNVFIDVASASKIAILQSILKEVNWTYVTTMSDGHQNSVWEHQHFLNKKDDSTCVQFSLFDYSTSDFNFSTIRTDGVIMFISNANDAASVIRAFPPSVAIVIVTDGKPMGDVTLDRKSIILTEHLTEMEYFADFMSGELLKNSGSDLVRDYFISKHKCTTDIVTGQIVCPDEDKINVEMLYLTSGKRFNMASTITDVVSETLFKAIMNNCTEFQSTGCMNMTEFDAVFDQIDVSYHEPSVNTSVLLSVEGQVQLVDTISLMAMAQPDVQLENLFTTLKRTITGSQCTGLCPDCKLDGCSEGSRYLYDGEYSFAPGDIVIVGMFPMTTNLELGREVLCSGYSIAENTDILVAAFMYAIRTFNNRYSDILENMTVGSLVFDSCSDNNRAAQIMMNFETCQYSFGIQQTGNEPSPVPSMVPAYVSYKIGDHQTGNQENTFGKLHLSVTDDGKVYKQSSLLFDNAVFNQDAVISLLRRMEWNHVGLITSQRTRSEINMAAFFDSASSNGICIGYELDISGGYQTDLDSFDTIRKSPIGVFVILADYVDIDNFFQVFLSKPVSKTWIIVESRNNWLHSTSVFIPAGSLILRPVGKLNAGFNNHIQAKINNQPDISNSKTWLDKFQKSRDNCSGCDLPNPLDDIETKLRASDIIRTVDVILHAAAMTVKDVCVNETGACRSLYTDGFQQMDNNTAKLLFNYEGQTVDLRSGYQSLEDYDIQNVQPLTVVKIGEWRNRQLSMDKVDYKAYDSTGDELRNGRRSVCYKLCTCLNSKNVTITNLDGDDVTSVTLQLLDEEMGYVDSTGEFNNDLWSIVVVIIAGSGAFATLCLMLYIICKICAGALVRRYLVLGLMLLVAMVFLFMSVLPFVFTPSEAVCGMRYFAHGVSYAFCFAIILTKLTTLRDYRYIGLGGEISRINQLFSVFFIVAVQIAMGIEWWVLRTPVLFTTTNITMDENNSTVLQTYYACDFKRGDFLAYHSFVIFLIVVCCLYSISVRKETKNMKEARLLLISSWFCFAIWIALIVTILVMDREYLEAICSIGILANALTLMVVVYFPKLTAISRLKYEFTDQKKAKENGYRRDSDFHFERPYSLPGTLHSSVTEKSLSYQRSLAAFDTSLSY